MKHVVCLLSFFAWSAIANHHSPMDGFPEGTYLGVGEYHSNDGDEGVYGSLAVIESEAWFLAHYRDHHIHLYSAFFNFDDHGFFDVELTRYAHGESETFTGQGYCWGTQCHLSADFGDSIFEETISFSEEDHLHWMGSITYKNNGPTLSWDESMERIADLE